MTRRPSPTPDLDPRDAELAQLRAAVDQVLTLCQDTFRSASHNQQLVDFVLDVRNRLALTKGRPRT